ncbi:ABC transporter permease [Desulfospira joergensenii]|uniref:ABC transporter permease n=1 Tax=Desulfospira joergensenii TaxID=53329 RepID=UPI0003B5F6CE|nr:iron ABC transporter permease [Desulfospira joergensenii]
MDGKHALNPGKIRVHPYALAGLVPAGFFLVFYFYPLSGIFWKSFFSDPTPWLTTLDRVFSSPRTMRIIWFTFWQAGVSTLLTLIFAFPCAFVLATYSFRGKRFLTTIASIPFVLPAIVVAAAFQALLGNQSLIFGLRINHPLVLIFLAHLFYNFSVMLRIISGFWTCLETRIKEAAGVLGASPRQVFIHVTLPLLKPAILAACTLVFIFCFSSFGIILILGGPSYSTIEAEIYRQAAHLFNLPAASLLSLVQILFTFGLMRAYTSLTRKAAQFSPEPNPARLRTARKPWEKLAVASVWSFVLGLCALPLLALVKESLVYKGKFSIIFYRALFENLSDSVFYIPPVHAVKFSLIFACTALIIAVLTGICAALFIRYCDRNLKGKWASFMDPIFMLPLSTSAVTLGFGIVITLDKPPLNLRTSIFLVPIAHALVGFPFVLRAVVPALRSVPENLHDAASLLGASPLRILREIDLPLISRSLAAGAIFSFTMSLGEFGATIFTARPGTPTIPVAIYRFLGQPGAMNYGQAMAMSSLLMGVTALGFIFIDRLRKNTREDF